jgi:hypothetical protein
MPRNYLKKLWASYNSLQTCKLWFGYLWVSLKRSRVRGKLIPRNLSPLLLLLMLLMLLLLLMLRFTAAGRRNGQILKN